MLDNGINRIYICDENNNRRVGSIYYKNNKISKEKAQSRFSGWAQYFDAREERLERPTPGFGDQCSTN